MLLHISPFWFTMISSPMAASKRHQRPLGEYSIIDVRRSDPLFCTCADATNSGYIIDMLGVENGSGNTKLFFLNNQYNQCNIGIKVFLMLHSAFYVHLNLNYYTFIFNINSEALLYIAGK